MNAETTEQPAPSSRRRGERRHAALVTGSTSGIGLAIATYCAAAGYDVMLNGFGDIAAIDAIRRRLADDHGVMVAYCPCDLAVPDDVQLLVDQTRAAFGSIDLLVNNAGILRAEIIEATSIEHWQQSLAINLTAAFLTMRAVVPAMKARRSGRIVNIASALGIVGQIACAAYGASKHGLVGLTKSVALEVAEHGVTVNVLCPGYVRTPLVEQEIKALAAARSIDEEAAAAEIVRAAHPTMQFVAPCEIGAMVAFLASDAARSITGAVLPLDAGWTAR